MVRTGGGLRPVALLAAAILLAGCSFAASYHTVTVDGNGFQTEHHRAAVEVVSVRESPDWDQVMIKVDRAGLRVALNEKPTSSTGQVLPLNTSWRAQPLSTGDLRVGDLLWFCSLDEAVQSANVWIGVDRPAGTSLPLANVPACS